MNTTEGTMVYRDLMVAPMRKELTRLGIRELSTPEEVDEFLDGAAEGTGMIVVNSVCGCAAGSMRPAVAAALEHDVRPAAMATVFAGQDADATERAREHFAPHPPSSPAIALLKNGAVVEMLPRDRFAGRDPSVIIPELTAAFDRHFGAADEE